MADNDKKEYLVRFSMTVKSDSPGNAVDSVVDGFVEFGLRNWTYRVDDPNAPEGTDSLVGFYDGYGEPVDIDALLADADQDEPEGEIGVDTVPAVEPEETDSDLLSYAESLNRTE